MRLPSFAKEPSPRRMLSTIALLVIGGLLSVVTVNLVIDPYDIWRVVHIPMLPNRFKQRGNDRMHKVALIQMEAPDGLILGTSRSQVTLDPRAKAFESYAQHVVNASVDACIPYEAMRYAQHAYAVAQREETKVKLIVYGLDLRAFDKERGPLDGHAEDRFLVSEAGRPQPFARAHDIAATLLSFDALRASLATIYHRSWPSYLRPLGQRDPALQEDDLQRAGGQRQFFQISERDYANNYGCFREAELGDSPYTDLIRLLEEAYSRGAKVRLYFSPVHARHNIVVRAAGLAAAERRFKRHVLTLVERIERRGLDVELWDFSAAEADEEVPPAEDTESRMRWWWESSHATSALGDRLLESMLVRHDGASLGRRLTRETLTSYLNQLADFQIAWEKAHLAEARAVRDAAEQQLGIWRSANCPNRKIPQRVSKP